MGIACAILHYKYPLLADWKMLSEFLGGYTYVYPGDRDIDTELAIAILKDKDYQTFYSLSHWLLSNCNKDTQRGLLKWILDSNNSHTQAY
jgi:hypothetical protein